jgi:hypothetical protein
MADRLRADLQLGTFANLVAKDLQKAIRMEAADEQGNCRCVTCGKRDHYKKMDAGHFIPGRRQSILFIEENLHPQCVYCNRHLYGNTAEYGLYMLKRYGKKKVEQLRAAKNQTKTYTRHELADMRDGYKARIKAQEQRLGK